MQDGNQQTESNPPDHETQIAGANYTSDEIQDNKQPQDSTEQLTEGSVVSWEASEYVHHHKGSSWFLGFAGIMLILVSVIYFLVRDVFSVVVMVVMGVAVAIYARREPKTVRYTLSPDEITVGSRHYPLDEFSSYTIIQEGGVYSLTLMPTRRFMPSVSIYFSPDDGDKIVDLLSRILPHEERSPDFIERLMRNIRF